MKYEVGKYYISKRSGKIVELIDLNGSYFSTVSVPNSMRGTPFAISICEINQLLPLNKFFKQLYGIEK